MSARYGHRLYYYRISEWLVNKCEDEREIKLREIGMQKNDTFYYMEQCFFIHLTSYWIMEDEEEENW